jgi:hypothetical protein
MKRSLALLSALAVLAPGCKTAGPRGPAAAVPMPDALSAYVGQVRFLSHRASDRSLTLRPGEYPSGDCEMAMLVRNVAFENGQARFSLETAGLPRVKGRAATCRKPQPGMQLVVAGLPTGGPQLVARVDEVLLSPEAYLKGKGVSFDRPPTGKPTSVASREVDANDAERRLGREVGAWPQLVLSVEAWYHDPSGRVRQEGEIEAQGTVGTDGRIYDPHVLTGLSANQEQAVLRCLALWRFEPARRGHEDVAARVPLRPILRIY